MAVNQDIREPIVVGIVEHIPTDWGVVQYVVTVAEARHVTMSTVGVLEIVTEEFKAKNVKMNASLDTMVRTANISVA